MKHLKEEFDKLTLKELIVYMLAFVTMVSAIVLVFLGMYLEPSGEIHASVLTYFGLSCGFCSIALGISAHYSNELAKFKANVMETIAQIHPDIELIKSPPDIVGK